MGPAGTIENGVVVCKDGKIAAVGPAGSTPVPEGMRVIEATVVTPGLIDARSTVGLSGIYNQRHDSDQLETSSAIQPELRALDAYNPREKLIEWVRSFGVTTLHTGHAPGEVLSGQTIVVKTVGNTVGEAVVKEPGAVVCTIGPDAHRAGGNPGTRGKEIAMLRDAFIKAREYQERRERAAKKEAEGKPADAALAEPAADSNDPKDKERRAQGDRNLRHEIMARVLAGEVPLLVTAQKAQDIDSALRLKEEFPTVRLWLDGAAEAQVMIDRIKGAGVPVIIHPPMMRAYGQMENSSFETAGKLMAAGVPVSLQAGYEGYVPKTRVVLLEAAILAANGLTMQQALATITISPAKLLGIEARVGSLEVGKDADVAAYDGDPFEYTSHCTATLIEGRVVFEGSR
jgi:imidazolonepropionase-like amidohydrolase